MQNKIKHIFLILLTSIAVNSFSQSNVMFDVFANTEYNYQNKYKEVKDFELSLKGEIDIEYAALRNEKGLNFDKLNKSIENLALNEWKDSKKKYELNNDIKAQIVKYNDFKFRKNDRNSRAVEGDFNAQLKSIDIKIISICNRVITFYQNFEYRLSIGNNRYNDGDIEINITKYFTADLYAQQIAPLKVVFNEAQQKQAQQVLMPFINDFSNDLKAYRDENPDDDEEDIVHEDDEYDEESETAYTRNAKQNNKEINYTVDFNDADFYWFGWGLMMHFPDYCKSSYINNGNAFEVFIPYHKCKSIIDLFPAYSSYKLLSKPENQFKNFDCFEVLNNYNKFRQEPSVTSLFKLNNVLDKPKKLTAGSYQTFKNNTKNFRGDFIYEFDTKAINFQHKASLTNYSYFLEFYNNKSTKRINTQAQNKSKHFYDEKRNLILRKSDETSYGGDFYYFYNADNCYTFQTHGSKNFAEELITKTSFKNNELCLTDVCLTFNNEMQVVAVKMLKYQHNNVELGFDEKARLIEAHTENDRYNYYYEYDALDRLIKYSSFEYQRISREVIFFYKDNERLPFLQKKHTLNHDTFEEETYLWEY
jgi:hypothetical protein